MKVRVYTDYDPIRILRGVNKKEFTEPTDSLAEKMGLVGAFVEVNESEIPSDRSYRAAWKVQGGKIKNDSAKVALIDAEKAQKEADVLIQAKMKELATNALKTDGVLDASGKVRK